MPEESVATPNEGEDGLARLERRLERLEHETFQENRWWRGGLIGALVLVALSILIASHRRHHPPPMMMGMGMGERSDGPRMMPYGPPPPPPYWGYPQGGPGYGDPYGRPDWRRPPWGGPGSGPDAPPTPPKG